MTTIRSRGGGLPETMQRLLFSRCRDTGSQAVAVATALRAAAP